MDELIIRDYALGTYNYSWTRMMCLNINVADFTKFNSFFSC